MERMVSPPTQAYPEAVEQCSVGKDPSSPSDMLVCKGCVFSACPLDHRILFLVHTLLWITR